MSGKQLTKEEAETMHALRSVEPLLSRKGVFDLMALENRALLYGGDGFDSRPFMGLAQIEIPHP